VSQQKFRPSVGGAAALQPAEEEPPALRPVQKRISWSSVINVTSPVHGVERNSMLNF